MSKESRRAARLARESRRLSGGGTPKGTVPSGPNAAPGAPTTGAAPSRGSSRPSGGLAGAGSTSTTRAGRRDRVRPAPKRSFLERYRTLLISAVALVVVVVAVGFVFIGSTAATYTCGSQFNPSPTPPVAPGSSARLGFQEDDMGNTHITSVPVNYLFCPPASGNHFGNNQGVTGPIPPRVYKPDDKVGPPNWVHNMEHGGMVILYRNDSPGATAAGLQAFRDYFSSFPPSPICNIPAGQLSPVIARFDDMPHPYAALVWDRVLYMDTWDPALATQFYLTESERLDSEGQLIAPPEKQCAAPSSSVAPGESAPAGSASPEVSAPAASVEPSASVGASAAPS